MLYNTNEWKAYKGQKEFYYASFIVIKNDGTWRKTPYLKIEGPNDNDLYASCCTEAFLESYYWRTEVFDHSDEIAVHVFNWEYEADFKEGDFGSW